MATIYIDNQPYEVDARHNLLHVCLSLGLNLPYFCWHPALGSVGACRQCAVKQFRDEQDTRGRLVMSCMTPAADGTRLSIDDPDARAFRASVIEWLMINHPHDCPVCDEGGECHLQDMTLMTGHTYRRYRFKKRTFRNQYLGPFINHEMNRCIECYRCVRFYREYAGGRDLDVFASHHHVYFGRHADGVLENEFSGNLVEVCPTGVFTDKTLKQHYTRKWDLQTAPSICVHCGLGCNTIPGERYNLLRRILNRYNGQVNGYFLCDRGRFGYGFVNSQRRIREPLLRHESNAIPAPITESHVPPFHPHPNPPPSRGREGDFVPHAAIRPHPNPLPSRGREGDFVPRTAIHSHPNPLPSRGREGDFIPHAAIHPHPNPSPSWGRAGWGGRATDDVVTARSTKEEALEHVASILAADTRVIGIGSPRASLEANFALRTLVGPERFHLGMSDRDFDMLSSIVHILQRGPARTPSLHDVEQADAVLILGEDVTNVAPRLALALRQSVRQQPMRIADKLGIARWNDAAVREAIQHEKGPLFIATPQRTKLDEVATQVYRAAPADIARLGFAVAHALNADAPAVNDMPDGVGVFVGRITQALQNADRPLIVAGTSLGDETIIQAASNVAWALCRNGRPAHLCLTVPECNSLGLALMGGGSLGAAFDAVRSGEADTVIILENDLYRRADGGAVRSFLGTCRHIIAIDHLAHATTEQAEVVLPAGTFAEADGTLVNNEGRAQRFFQVFVPDGEIQESWRWLRDMMVAAGRDELSVWQDLDDVIEALAEALPVFARIPEVAPPATFRIAGQKIPRQPHRYSGRTAMTAHITIHEPKPPDDPDAPLVFSMEGHLGRPPSPLIPLFWAPGWNSAQATNKFQSEVGGPLRGGDPGVRLIEPAQAGTFAHFSDVPAPFTPRQGACLLVPLYHIFGTEELSALSPAVDERVPRPYLALNQEDAAALHVTPDAELEFTVAGTTFRLPVKADSDLPRGLAGLPVGLPGLHGIELPVWCTLSRIDKP